MTFFLHLIDLHTRKSESLPFCFLLCLCVRTGYEISKAIVSLSLFLLSLLPSPSLAFSNFSLISSQFFLHSFSLSSIRFYFPSSLSLICISFFSSSFLLHFLLSTPFLSLISFRVHFSFFIPSIVLYRFFFPPFSFSNLLSFHFGFRLSFLVPPTHPYFLPPPLSLKSLPSFFFLIPFFFHSFFFFLCSIPIFYFFTHLSCHTFNFFFILLSFFAPFSYLFSFFFLLPFY